MYSLFKLIVTGHSPECIWRDYGILGGPYANVVTISTSRGKHNIFVGSGTGAVIKLVNQKATTREDAQRVLPIFVGRKRLKLFTI